MDVNTSVSNPVRDAIDAQASRTDRVVAIAGLVFAGAGLVIIGILWVAPSPALASFQGRAAPAIAALNAALLLWFIVCLALNRRGIGARLVPWISTLIEAGFPMGVMLIELHSQSAAFSTWASLGPYIYIFMFVMGIVRLKWPLLMLMAFASSVGYGALLIYAVPRLPLVAADPILQSPLIYAMRPVMMLVAGGIGALVVTRLRNTVAEVHQRVRSEELFGKYRLGKVLAAGGMGEVLAATYCPEGGFQKSVAVKRIHSHLALDAKFVDGFRREAELGSRLAHPNIVQVLDFGSEGGGYFLAMEFVDGLTLSQVMKGAMEQGQPLQPGLVAMVGRQIALALVFAHSEARDAAGGRLRVIHRDLSPANVMLSRAGEVKVTDFGVAKALGEKEETVTTSVAGKLSYMAPEQVLAQPLDERCDLFSLGVLLWEALCGQRLFRSIHDAATLHEVLNKVVPPPSTIRGDLLSPCWDAFMTKAICRDRAERFASAQEMAAALDAIRSDEEPCSTESLSACVIGLMEYLAKAKGEALLAAGPGPVVSVNVSVSVPVVASAEDQTAPARKDRQRP